MQKEKCFYFLRRYRFFSIKIGATIERTFKSVFINEMAHKKAATNERKKSAWILSKNSSYLSRQYLVSKYQYL